MNEMIRHRTQTSESEKKDDIHRPMPETNKHEKTKLKPAENKLG